MNRLHLMLLAAVLCAACDNSLSPSHWSELRDALTLGGDADEVLALARARDGERVSVDVAPEGDDAHASVGAPIRAVDRERARAGDDALVAAAYRTVGGRVTARGCGALFDAAPAARVTSVAGWSEADAARVRALAPRLTGWLASCDGDGADGPVTITPGPGMPALVAWLPERGELRVHPALLALAADRVEPASPPLATVSAPLIDAGVSCRIMLDNWCERCTVDSGAACPPLFGPNAPFESCATVDAIVDTSAQTALHGGQWRQRYCDWRDLETDPRARYYIVSYDFQRPAETPCWDRTVAVHDAVSWLDAFRSWDSSCDTALTDGRNNIDAGSTPRFGGEVRPERGTTVSQCAAYVSDVICPACTPDPDNLCGGFFDRSTVAEDCYDLGRAESHGGGFAALCLYGAAFSFIDRGCFNLYDQCWWGFVGGTDDLTTLEELIYSVPGFFEADTAERCIAQAERCLAGDPLWDFEPDKPFPQTPAEATPDTSSEDSKCPQ